MFVQPPRTLPAPIGAYLATGGDWRAYSMGHCYHIDRYGLYYPFFKIYDNKQLMQEMEGEA